MISMIFLISLDRNALAGRFSRAGPAASLGRVRSAATSLRRYPPPLRLALAVAVAVAVALAVALALVVALALALAGTPPSP